jgi:hypothetical protein
LKIGPVSAIKPSIVGEIVLRNGGEIQDGRQTRMFSHNSVNFHLNQLNLDLRTSLTFIHPSVWVFYFRHFQAYNLLSDAYGKLHKNQWHAWVFRFIVWFFFSFFTNVDAISLSPLKKIKANLDQKFKFSYKERKWWWFLIHSGWFFFSTV